MPKKMPKNKARKYLPKLDPLLLLAAARAPQEKKKDLSKLLTRLGTTPGAITTPSSVRDLPVGIHTLAAQMSATAVQQFVHDDLVPVLVDSEKAQQVQKKVKEWKGTAKTITPGASWQN